MTSKYIHIYIDGNREKKDIYSKKQNISKWIIEKFFLLT